MGIPGTAHMTTDMAQWGMTMDMEVVVVAAAGGTVAMEVMGTTEDTIMDMGVDTMRGTAVTGIAGVDFH